VNLYLDTSLLQAHTFTTPQPPLTKNILTMTTPVATTMTPTTTDSCTKRRRDDANVSSLLQEGLQGEGNKRTRLNSTEILARSLHQSPGIAELQTMATLVVTEREAMDSTAREAASSNNEIRLVDCMGMPHPVYPLIWSFLLDSTTCSDTASSLDFKSIWQFMLVNKSSKGAFDDCRGWWLCAQALKREAEAKQLLIDHFGDRAAYVEKFCDETPTYVEEIQRARQTNSRIISIQSALLPEASRLAVLYGSEEVSMDEYRSIERFIDLVDYFVFMKYGGMGEFLRTLRRVTSSLESVVFGDRYD
jgi:hypothetical protein